MVGCAYGTARKGVGAMGGAPPPSFPCPDTGIHAPSRRVGGARPASSPTWTRGIPAQRATSVPPPNASQPLPCLLEPVLSSLKPVLSPSKGGHSKPTWPGAPGREPDLRVNVAKCLRMSHYFAPPLVNPCNLRVENLTVWAHSRPFWPISVHSRLTRRHLRLTLRHPRAPTREIHAPSRRVGGAHLATLACNPASPPVRRRARARGCPNGQQPLWELSPAERP